MKLSILTSTFHYPLPILVSFSEILKPTIFWNWKAFAFREQTLDNNVIFGY